MSRFDGKVVIITGAGSGIGRQTAMKFAEEGARIGVVDIDGAAANETALTIQDAGREAVAVACDVSKRLEVERAIQTVISTFHRIDILFNNAGIVLPKYIDEVDEDEWDRLFDVNVKGYFLFTKYALPHLREAKGNIVNMGSMTGISGQKRNATYSATKGAISSFTRSIAIDLAPDEVRVNAVCPAGVMTPLLERWFAEHGEPEKVRRGQDLSHMLGRTATTDEIANVVLFLASNDASFITGQSIPVEGGATIGYGIGPKAEWS